MSNAIILPPRPKPDLGSVAAVPQSGTETAGASQPQSIKAGMRPVRVVGPVFFPAE